MKKRYLYIGFTVMVMIIAGIVWRVYAPSAFPLLPHSFTIYVYGDFTSSAANRSYEATLVGKDDTLLGVERYHSEDGKGNTISISCIIKDARWVLENKPDELCDTRFVSLPTTVRGLTETIVRRELLPKKECRHNKLCYELVD